MNATFRLITCFRSPRVFFQSRQQTWQNEFNAVGGKFTHNYSGSVVGSGSHVLTRIAEAQQQMRQYVNDVRLEQSAKHRAQHLEGK